MARIEPFSVSNDLLDQPEKLRERAQQDGYLFFRDLIDADSIYNLRRDFLGICHRHGWAQGGAALMDGVRTGGPFMEGDDGYWPVLDEFQSLESFHAFAHHPAILDVCATKSSVRRHSCIRGILEELCSRRTQNTRHLHIKISSISGERKRPIPDGYRLGIVQKSWVGCPCYLDRIKEVYIQSNRRSAREESVLIQHP